MIKVERVKLIAMVLVSVTVLAGCRGESPPQTLDGYHPDITQVVEIDPADILDTPHAGWNDSYSVGDRCYCSSTFDHSIGGIQVETPYGNITVLEACEIVGPGPGAEGRPVYNDIQCGNGPPNDAGDEHWCPGRVDLGKDGCGQIGPKWNFD